MEMFLQKNVILLYENLKLGEKCFSEFEIGRKKPLSIGSTIVIKRNCNTFWAKKAFEALQISGKLSSIHSLSLVYIENNIWKILFKYKFNCSKV